MGPKPSGGGSTTGETTDETQPRKKHKRNKKPKDTQPDGAGTAATVTKDKTPAVTLKDPPKVSTPSYCFWCGDDIHTSKTCKETWDLRCDNHANTKSLLTKVCNIYRRANNLVVLPWLVRSEGSANRAHTENEDEIFGSHPDD